MALAGDAQTRRDERAALAAAQLRRIASERNLNWDAMNDDERLITFDKNDPSWGSALKEKITSSLHETLRDPLETVPNVFLKTKSDSKPAVVTETEKAILTLSQNVDRLSGEMARFRQALAIESSPSFIRGMSASRAYGGGGSHLVRLLQGLEEAAVGEIHDSAIAAAGNVEGTVSPSA